MPTVTETAIIPAPTNKVFAVLADVARYDEWLTIHAGFPDGAPEVIEVGTEFRQKVKIMGMPGEVKWTVTDVEADSAIAMDGQGPAGIVLHNEFKVTPEGAGTEVTYTSEFSGGTMSGPMGKTLAKHSAKSAKDSLGKLAGLV